MSDRPLRLGDVVDDYCPRCRLLLNHDIASLTEGQIAKVTCRTCFNTHDYRHGQDLVHQALVVVLLLRAAGLKKK